MQLKRGRFIVIEGTDGTGKSTQTNRLLKKLVMEGYSDSKIADFPQYGNNIFADTVAEYLNKEFGDPTQVNPYLASLPYAADRLKAAPEIRSELRKGSIVLANRYFASNSSHQGAKIEDPREREHFLEWLRRVETGEEGFNIPKPDLTILLHLAPEIARKLVESKGGRSYSTETLDGHERDMEYQKRVVDTYLHIARSEPSWRVIECAPEGTLLTPEKIAEEIWKIVKPILPTQLNSP